MFGMITNKSRRLLRRASTRENLLRKQEEKDQLPADNEIAAGGRHLTNSSISQSYAVGISEVDILDSPLEKRGFNPLSGDNTFKTLARSTSCTNIFFGQYFSETTSLRGRLTSDQYSYDHLQKSKINSAGMDVCVSDKSLIEQNQPLIGDQLNINDFRTPTTTVMSDHNVSSGTGSCTDLSYTLRCSKDYERKGGCPNLDTSPSKSSSSHRIGLRVELLLPGTHDVSTAETKNTTTHAKTKTSGTANQDSVGSKGEVNIKENLTRSEDKNKCQEKSESSNHSSHPTKTLLRSRSCSFIVSLSYKLNDGVNILNSSDSNKLGSSAENDLPINSATKTAQEKSESNEKFSADTNSQKSVRHLRRLSRSHSLLNFAGFTKSTQSRKNKSEYVPSGRKSTILEHENELRGDSFDDICAADEKRFSNVHSRNGTDPCPIKQSTDTSIKDSTLQLCNAVNGNQPKDDSKYDVAITKPRDSGVATCNGQSNNACENRSKALAVKNNDNCQKITHDDHVCSHLNCHQCQFMSQFVVPGVKPISSPSSRNQNRPRNPKIRKSYSFGKKNSTKALRAIYLPTISFDQDKDGKSIPQSNVPIGNFSFASGAVYPTGKCSPDPGTKSRVPRSQPHQPNPPTRPKSKRASSLQTKISTLTRALGIFAKRNELLVEKPHSGTRQFDAEKEPISTVSKGSSYCAKTTPKTRKNKIKQLSVDEILNSTLGVPLSEGSADIVTPSPTPAVCPEIDSMEAQTKDLSNNHDERPTKENLEKGRIFLQGVATSPITRRTPNSTKLQKSCQKISGAENFGNKFKKSKPVCKTVSEVSSTGDTKHENVTDFVKKPCQDNSRKKQNLSRSKNSADGFFKTRPKTSETTKTHSLETRQKAHRSLDVNICGHKIDPNSQLAASGIKGFYSVLPPILDGNLRQRHQTSSHTTKVKE